MSMEITLKTLLGALVGNRAYPDITPDNPVFPLIVYQQVGGVAQEFLEQKMMSKDHARMQIAVWAKTRLEASSIARLARVAIIEGGVLVASTYAAPVSLYDDTLKLYGNRTDYGIWYTP